MGVSPPPPDSPMTHCCLARRGFHETSSDPAGMRLCKHREELSLSPGTYSWEGGHQVHV